MVHPSGACKKYGPRLRAQVSGDSGRVLLGTLIPFRRVLHSHSLGRLAWQIDWEAKPCRENGRTTKRKQVLPCCIRSTPMGGSGHGATEIYIAVPADRDPQPVRHVSTSTEDLHAAAVWLKACPIETVAMESTGVYWIPFFQILEARGFQVLLVNTRHVKNVPGRKSDVSDCQWLQYLHSVGLPNGSFRPAQAVCTVRAILRHRNNLVQMASGHAQHKQEALDQMNVQCAPRDQ